MILKINFNMPRKKSDEMQSRFVLRLKRLAKFSFNDFSISKPLFYSSSTNVSFTAIWPTQKKSFYDFLKFNNRVSSPHGITVCYCYC